MMTRLCYCFHNFIYLDCLVCIGTIFSRLMICVTLSLVGRGWVVPWVIWLTTNSAWWFLYQFVRSWSLICTLSFWTTLSCCLIVCVCVCLFYYLHKYQEFLTMKYYLYFAVPYNYLHRYQKFYEEGEREILLTEVSSLREQVLVFLEFNTEVISLLDSLFFKILRLTFVL